MIRLTRWLAGWRPFVLPGLMLGCGAFLALLGLGAWVAFGTAWTAGPSPYQPGMIAFSMLYVGGWGLMAFGVRLSLLRSS